DEETLLYNVVKNNDPQAGGKLMESGGWKTLIAVLREAGERPLKHRRSDDNLRTAAMTDQLAKRFRGVSLDKKFLS
ncbi:hypothetical protein LTS18_002409, partial [Coniosporium uncinatum]